MRALYKLKHTNCTLTVYQERQRYQISTLDCDCGLQPSLRRVCEVKTVSK